MLPSLPVGTRGDVERLCSMQGSSHWRRPQSPGWWGLEPSGQKDLISELMGFFITSLVILNMLRALSAEVNDLQEISNFPVRKNKQVSGPCCCKEGFEGMCPVNSLDYSLLVTGVPARCSVPQRHA